MTKTEFLTLLEQRLMVLNNDERSDLLSEYEQHIEMKIQSGLSEEEAIADFGDPEELIKELLDAYHLNTSYQSSGSTFTARITYYLKNSAHFISSMFDTLFHYKLRELFRLCLQFCFLLFFLSIIWCGGAFVLHILYATIGQFWIGRVLFDILQIFAWLAFIALTIYMIIFFIRRYILIDYEPLDAPTLSTIPSQNVSFYAESVHLDEQINHAIHAGKAHVSHLSEQTNDAFSRIKQKAAESREEKAIVHSKKAQQTEKATKKVSTQKASAHVPFPEMTLSTLCMKIIIWCCKVFAFFFLLCAGCATLALIAGSAAMLVFVLAGYQIIGPFLIVLGCTLLSVVITAMLMQFVFGIGGAQQ